MSRYVQQESLMGRWRAPRKDISTVTDNFIVLVTKVMIPKVSIQQSVPSGWSTEEPCG